MDDKKLNKEKRQAQLDEWKAEIDVLKARADKASAETRLKLKKKIAEAEDSLDNAKSKLAEIVEAGDEKWQSFRSGLENSIKSIKSSIEEKISAEDDEQEGSEQQ